MDLKLPDLSRSKIQLVVINYMIMNPGEYFSLENIHDMLLRHYRINLAETKVHQRNQFARRMRAAMDAMVETQVIEKKVELAALPGGKRVRYTKAK